MKRSFANGCVGFLGLLLTSAYLHAQGTVNFANRFAGIVDAPMFDVGGVDKLSGPDAYAQLWAAPSADSLLPVGQRVQLRSGTGAGYWVPTVVVIPTVKPGDIATVQVRWWKGATGSTYAEAWIKGEGSIFSVRTGGDGIPPSLPANLVGLTSFSLVPEPGGLWLALLAAGIVSVRRFLR